MTATLTLKSFGQLMVGTMISLPIMATVGFSSAIAQEGEDLEFNITNSTSDRSIVEFSVSPTSSDEWGDNLLTDIGEVQPGETLAVTIQDGLLTCSYDTRAVWSDDSTTEEMNVNMCESPSWDYTD